VKRVVVVMEHTSKEGEPKFKPYCELPLTGTNVVDMLITDLAVFSRGSRHEPFKLVEIAPASRRPRSGRRPRPTTSARPARAGRVRGHADDSDRLLGGAGRPQGGAALLFFANVRLGHPVLAAMITTSLCERCGAG